MGIFSRFRRRQHIRIPARPGEEADVYATVQLTSSFDYLDVLSMSLSQREAYALAEANYGVISGRVVANEGVGVPNCRVSVFVPRADGDGIPAAFRDVYPWQDPLVDTDSYGRRYNILPAAQRVRGFNGFPDNELGIGATPITPIGTFPERETVLSDPLARAVYERYYCYTTTTNQAGDYLLTGIPLGSHYVHMEADLTDIGPWSYSPAMLRELLGYPETAFSADGYRMRSSTDLDSLQHIIKLGSQVNVRPLWSQQNLPLDQQTVGVCRQDFRLTVPLRPHTTLVGTAFTMARNHWWGDNVVFRLHFGWRNFYLNVGNRICDDTPGCDFKVKFCVQLNTRVLDIKIGPCPRPKRGDFELCFSVEIPNILPFFRFEVVDDYCRLDGGKYDSSAFDIINHGKTCERSVTAALQEVPFDGISDALFLDSHRPEEPQITVISVAQGVSDEQAVRWTAEQAANAGRVTSADWRSFDPETDLQVLTRQQYVEMNRDGVFALQVFCNRRPMITNERGVLVDSPDPQKGVFTEFRGSLYLRGTSEADNPRTKDRVGQLAFKVPQAFDYNQRSNGSGGFTGVNLTREWMFQHGLFRAGELYAVAQRIATRKPNQTEAEEKRNEINDYSTGWDVQTGLLFTRLTPTAVDAIPTNHETVLGDERDYTLVDGETPTAGTPPTSPQPTGGQVLFIYTGQVPAQPTDTLENGIRVTIDATAEYTPGDTLLVEYSWAPDAGQAAANALRLAILFEDTLLASFVVEDLKLDADGNGAYTWTTVMPEQMIPLAPLKSRMVLYDELDENIYGVSQQFVLNAPPEPAPQEPLPDTNQTS
jgi:hypothetical protein